MESPSGGEATFVEHNRSRSKIAMHGTDEGLVGLPRLLGHATAHIAGGYHLLGFGFPRRLRWLFDFACYRSADH
jgi:hypothetical protein